MGLKAGKHEFQIDVDQEFFTNFPESEIEDFRFQTTGDYGGIGATIRKVDQFVVIYEPYKNFPADKAGLKMGDVFIEIDGQKIIDTNTADVSELLKGTPGTNVEVKIKRWHNHQNASNHILFIDSVS